MPIKLSPVIDFGKMPIANAFLTPEEFSGEYFYNMVLGYDPNTHAIGLVHTVPPEKMFHDHYAYFASTSKSMQKHFRETAEKLLPFAKQGLVVEIGSNDGIMLESWKELGVPAIGIEPSSNVADASIARGHQVIKKFISQEVVDEILAQGKVSLFYGANVSCHIENLAEYLRCVTALIGKEGVFVFEDPYFLDMVEKTSYDQIYDEHVWYFTLSFINTMLKPLGFHVFDCEHIDVHGGQLRMYVGHVDTHSAKPAVAKWSEKERNLEFDLQTFKTNVLASKKTLVDMLVSLKKQGKKICGFGATSKATTILNYCSIGPDLISFVTDNTPGKQGKYYPGVHIPVRPQEEFRDIDIGVLFAWNHAQEVERLPIVSAFRQRGGKWLVHVPEPHLF